MVNASFGMMCPRCRSVTGVLVRRRWQVPGLRWTVGAGERSECAGCIG